MSMIEYQRLIMADTVRTAAFEKTLHKIIKPGCTVVDVGSGTGFLAFLASKLGAKRCILIEREPEFLEISKEMARLNNIKNCTFLCAQSHDVKKSLNADIVISETLGNFAYEENIIETLHDARRFLKPSGVMIPQSLRMVAAPVVRNTQWKEVAIWDHLGFDLEWSPCKERSVNNMYVKKVDPADLLLHVNSAQQWDEVIFFPPPRLSAVALLAGHSLDDGWAKAEGEGRPQRGPSPKGSPLGFGREGVKSIRHATLEWRLEHPTTIYGLCLWWECTLVPGITISTSPLTPPTHWQQIFLPVPDPIIGKPNDTIVCVLHSNSRRSVKINLQWEVARMDSKGQEKEHYRMDMRRGI